MKFNATALKERVQDARAARLLNAQERFQDLDALEILLNTTTDDEISSSELLRMGFKITPVFKR
jgi:hypothetical protein